MLAASFQLPAALLRSNSASLENEFLDAPSFFDRHKRSLARGNDFQLPSRRSKTLHDASDVAVVGVDLVPTDNARFGVVVGQFLLLTKRTHEVRHR